MARIKSKSTHIGREYTPKKPKDDRTDLGLMFDRFAGDVEEAVEDVKKQPSKAIEEAHEIATRLSVELPDRLREAQELADAHMAAAQAEADKVKEEAHVRVREAQSKAKEVERVAAEDAHARAIKIRKQFVNAKNWEGKAVLPNYNQKKATVEGNADKAHEEAKRMRSEESEIKALHETHKVAAESAAKVAEQAAKKVDHILQKLGR